MFSQQSLAHSLVKQSMTQATCHITIFILKITRECFNCWFEFMLWIEYFSDKRDYLNTYHLANTCSNLQMDMVLVPSFVAIYWLIAFGTYSELKCNKVTLNRTNSHFVCCLY